MRLRDVSEDELLARVFPVLAGARPAAWASVPVGPGDDAAVRRRPGRAGGRHDRLVVRGRDWRDDWSTRARRRASRWPRRTSPTSPRWARVPTALLVIARRRPRPRGGVGGRPRPRARRACAEQAGCAGRRRRPVVGAGRGASSSRSPRSATSTAGAGAPLGSPGRRRRRGVRLARAGPAAGWPCSSAASPTPTGRPRMPVRRRRGAARRARPRRARADAPPPGPVPPWRAGPRAAAAGAHAMIDVSDGLVTDLGRVAAASGVRVDLDGSVLRERYAAGRSPWRSARPRRCTRCSPGERSTRCVGVFADAASLAARRRVTPP